MGFGSTRRSLSAAALTLALASVGAACGGVAVTPIGGDTPPPTATAMATGTPIAADWKLRGAIVTTAGVIDPGEITVLGDTITCVGASCPTGAEVPVYDAGGYVFPGLVDLHNHVGYDFLPAWTPSHTYSNRNQWQSDSAYADAKQPYVDNQSAYTCEMTKYAEIGQLVSGVTTTEGAPSRTCIETLVRDIDNYNELGTDWVRTNILGISSVTDSDAANLRAQMDTGATRAYLIHLAEGIDATSRNEWDALAAKNLVRKETVIIHGTALTDAEFQQMAAAGMPLVWSPVSNLNLYGATTDVATAKADGVRISLAPDWTLSGSANMLDELHAAAAWSDANGQVFTDRELFDMATSHPADAASYGNLLGRLQPGAKADLFVLKGWDGADPWTSLVRHATRADVALVVIGGVGLYGTPDRMAPFATDLSETVSVCGEDRLVTVAKPITTDLLGQTWSDIRSTILGFDPAAIDPLACE